MQMKKNQEEKFIKKRLNSLGYKHEEVMSF